MATALTRKLRINGTMQHVSVRDDTEPLLYVLRDQLQLNGPKFGCGVAQCGACTVLVDGKITRSCVTKMNTLSEGARITTLDGLGSSHKPHPLQQAFVDQQAGQSNPKPSAPDGLLSGCGIAYLEYENRLAYVAAAAEVLMNPNSGDVQVTRVVVTHDCGQIINPDGLSNQIDGNVIQSLSRTIKEQVAYDDNGVTSVVLAQNQYFPGKQYSILHFTEVPTVEVVLIDQPASPPWGAGEPVTEVIPAVIGNAIYDATGARLHTIPFTPDRVLEALSNH